MKFTNVWKESVRWILKILLVILAAYLTIILLDVFVGWQVYGYLFEKLAGYGVSDYLSGAIAVWLAAATLWFGPAIVVSVLRGRKDWIWKTALVASVWLGILYTVSYPYWDGIFDPLTGNPRFRYSKTSDGKIKKFPKGLRYDKDTGQELRDFDPATADEYFKQQSKNLSKTSQARSEGIFAWFSGGDPNIAKAKQSSDNVSLWVEKMQIASDRTILYLAVKAGEEGKDGGRLYPAGNCGFVAHNTAFSYTPPVAYLVDESGETYDLRVDTGSYDGHFNDGLFFLPIYKPIRQIRVDEIYRFTLVFPALKPGVTTLRFHHHQFEPLQLDGFLATAERIDPEKSDGPLRIPSEECYAVHVVRR